MHRGGVYGESFFSPRAPLSSQWLTTFCCARIGSIFLGSLSPKRSWKGGRNPAPSGLAPNFACFTMFGRLLARCRSPMIHCGIGHVATGLCGGEALIPVMILHEMTTRPKAKTRGINPGAPRGIPPRGFPRGSPRVAAQGDPREFAPLQKS